ncbi:MAG: HPr family phosphocarrier protein [Alphaproteobacteria bacterium]|nr:HPr family phosphocarrier protein [Alphaproteobacteria bacterium]
MSDEPAHRARFVIPNARGLHARASAKFVRALTGIEAQVLVEKDGVSVSARSIMGLLTLGAAQGTEIEVSASGPDAEKAMEAIASLIERHFDET